MTAEGTPKRTNVHVSNHPILSHKISILRSSSTAPKTFRAVLRELTFNLGYEATSTLTTKLIPLTVPVDNEHVEHTGQALAEKVALVPILRSGLGMVDSMLELVPDAAVHHIGMYRREMMPVQYYNRLPKKCEVDVVYVLDPIIATSNTIMSVIGILKKVSRQSNYCVECVYAYAYAYAYAWVYESVEVCMRVWVCVYVSDGLR